MSGSLPSDYYIHSWIIGLELINRYKELELFTLHVFSLVCDDMSLWFQSMTESLVFKHDSKS